MRPADNMENLIKKLRYKASTETHDRVLGNVFEALDKFEEQKPSAPAQKIRVTIMKNPITKLAAAAVIIIAVLLSTTYFEIGGKKVFEIGAKQAYALEQTLRQLMRSGLYIAAFMKVRKVFTTTNPIYAGSNTTMQVWFQTCAGITGKMMGVSAT
ncbi:MAG: hypothetical protein ACYSWZ_10565 [Planctomycetota bacterium]|jgi:hypothetical protein